MPPYRNHGGDGFPTLSVCRTAGAYAWLTREICEAGRALGVPILYGEIAPIELYAREYRDVAFIIPHLGSFVDDWAAQLQLIDHLTRHPNVFTDTAGVRRFDLLVEVVRRAGPGKVLFGSDGPSLHPAVELAKIRALNLKPEHERAILVVARALHRLRIGPECNGLSLTKES